MAMLVSGSVIIWGPGSFVWDPSWKKNLLLCHETHVLTLLLQGSFNHSSWGDQTMQMYGNLRDFPYNRALFGNIMTPVLIRHFPNLSRNS